MGCGRGCQARYLAKQWRCVMHDSSVEADFTGVTSIS